MLTIDLLTIDVNLCFSLGETNFDYERDGMLLQMDKSNKYTI